MPTFYTQYNKRNIISSPDFNRNRHAYRSPRDSYKINVESEQFRYSVKILYSRYDSVNQDLIAKATTLTEGGTVPVKYNSNGGSDVELKGLESLASELLDAKRRVKELERVL